MENGTQDTKPTQRFLAPTIHTFLLSVLVIALVPMTNWLRTLVDLRHPLTLSEALFVAMLLQWTLVGLTWVGTALGGHHPREFLGENWQNARDIKGDFRFACIVVLLLVLSTFFVGLLGPFDTSNIDTASKTPVQLILSLFVALSAGLTEELIFRGYLMRQFAVLTQNEKIGLLSQAALFALAHGSGQTLTGILDKFLVGYFLGWSAIRRKSLVPGIIAHCGLNILGTLLLYLFPRTLHL